MKPHSKLPTHLNYVKSDPTIDPKTTSDCPLPFPTPKRRGRGPDAPRPDLSREQRAALFEMLGINPEGAPGTYAMDGRTLIVIPGFARAPAVGTECPWTGLSYEVFRLIRKTGVRAADGSQIMPPFQGWCSMSEAETGGKRGIHINVQAVLEYMREWCTVAAARREARAQAKAEAEEQD